MRKVFSDLAVKFKSMLERCNGFFELVNADEVSEQRRADKEQDRYGLKSSPFTYDEKGNRVTCDNKQKPN